MSCIATLLVAGAIVAAVPMAQRLGGARPRPWGSAALRALDQRAGQALAVAIFVASTLHASLVRPAGLWFVDDVLPAIEEGVQATLCSALLLTVRGLNLLGVLILALLRAGEGMSGAACGGSGGAGGGPQAVQSQQSARAKHWERWLAGARGTFNSFVLRGTAESAGEAAGKGERAPAAAEAAGPDEPEPAAQEKRHLPAGNGAGAGSRAEPEREPAAAGQLRQAALGRRVRRWLSLRLAPSAGATRAHLSFALRSGEAMFPAPPGQFAVQQGMARRGLADECSLALQLAVAATFDAWRTALRAVLRLGPPADSPGGLLAQRLRGRAAPAAAPPPGTRLAKLATRRLARGHARRGHAWWSPLLWGRPSQHLEDLGVWTTSDAIIHAGYPVEEHSVTTSDGYILHASLGKRALCEHWANSIAALQRWSRVHSLRRLHRHTQWAVQSVGISSLAWRSDKRKRGAPYFAYSANELAINDIGAMIEHIHHVKMAELQPGGHPGHRLLHRLSSREQDAERGGAEIAVAGASFCRLGDGSSTGTGPGVDAAGAGISTGDEEVLPYRLQAVGHSMGGGSLLMYATEAHMRGRPHRLRRIVALSPSGFHSHLPLVGRINLPITVPLIRLLDWLGWGFGVGLWGYYPRVFGFALIHDLRDMPALHELASGASLSLCARHHCCRAERRQQRVDKRSQAAALPQAQAGRADCNGACLPKHSDDALHPKPTLMSPSPECACASAASQYHIVQWGDLQFRLYDHGSPAANMARYGAPQPPSLVANYHLLRGMQVDIVAGTRDGVIAAADVRRHYDALREAGVEATYREMDYGHMDFTLSRRDDVREFVRARLQRPL
eukprot:scaffold15.g4246.t1